MKQKAQFVFFGSVFFIAISFIIYQKGLFKGYKVGYNNASEIMSKNSSQCKTE